MNTTNLTPIMRAALLSERTGAGLSFGTRGTMRALAARGLVQIDASNGHSRNGCRLTVEGQTVRAALHAEESAR